jgi:hypothetical protein
LTVPDGHLEGRDEDVDRRRVTPGRRLLAAVPLAAAAVLVLTACDPRQAGSAAVVGSTRITESQVQADAQESLDTLKAVGGDVPDTADLIRAQVEFRVDTHLVDVAAARQGVHVTQGQVDELISASGPEEQLIKSLVEQQNLWLPPSQVDALAREYLQQQALGTKLAPGKTTDEQNKAVTEYVTKIADELGVTVSPRYGEFDFANLRITPGLDDLSVPAGSPTGSPSPSASAAPTG